MNYYKSTYIYLVSLIVQQNLPNRFRDFPNKVLHYLTTTCFRVKHFMSFLIHSKKGMERTKRMRNDNRAEEHNSLSESIEMPDAMVMEIISRFPLKFVFNVKFYPRILKA